MYLLGRILYYANSDIKQERKITQDFEDWTPENCENRRIDLTSWIIKNWGIGKQFQQVTEEIVDEEEELLFYEIDS